MFLQDLKLGPLVAALQSGERSLLAFLEETCERVQRLDGQILAFIPEPRRRDRLFAEARALLARFPTPAYRPPLFGIPIGVKDILRVDGFPTRVGSRLPPEVFAGPESRAVAQLRAAGALVLGKTIMSEFAYTTPGPTRNPHNLSHTPGGSSSGSAAAVAAGFCPLSLGTQTLGSIIRPAALCGVVGFKPTYDRISNEGAIHFCKEFDHVGFFAQDVEGISLTAALLCRDWRMPAREVRRPVLGVPEGPYLEQAAPEALGAFERQLARLRDKGYTVRRFEIFEDVEQINARHRRMVAAGMAAAHASWYEMYRSLYSDPSASLFEEGLRVTEEMLVQDRNARDLLRANLSVTMHSEGIDLWVTPSTVGPAPRGNAASLSPLMSVPWTHAWLPSLSVPAGFSTSRLPLGLQLIGGYGDDERLLLWGRGVAQALAPA